MRPIALAVSLLLFCNACFASHQIRQADLLAFDGYTADHRVQGPLEADDTSGTRVLRAHLLEPGVLKLRDARDGEWFDFDPETEVRFTAGEQQFGSGTLKLAEVSQQSVHAKLTDGSELQAPLASIDRVESRKFSTGRTVAFGLGLFVAPLVGLAIYGLANFYCHC